jgi:hypothetical protein
MVPPVAPRPNTQGRPWSASERSDVESETVWTDQSVPHGRSGEGTTDERFCGDRSAIHQVHSPRPIAVSEIKREGSERARLCVF